MTEGGATRMKRNGARLFKNPPQPHMCIQDFIQGTAVPCYVNVLSWEKIAMPLNPTQPVRFYGGMRVRPPRTKTEAVVFAVMANPEILRVNGKNAQDPKKRTSLIEHLLDFVERMNTGIIFMRQYTILKDRDITGELKEVWNAVQARRDLEQPPPQQETWIDAQPPVPQYPQYQDHQQQDYTSQPPQYHSSVAYGRTISNEGMHYEGYGHQSQNPVITQNDQMYQSGQLVPQQYHGNVSRITPIAPRDRRDNIVQNIPQQNCPAYPAPQYQFQQLPRQMLPQYVNSNVHPNAGLNYGPNTNANVNPAMNTNLAAPYQQYIAYQQRIDLDVRRMQPHQQQMHLNHVQPVPQYEPAASYNAQTTSSINVLRLGRPHMGVAQKNNASKRQMNSPTHSKQSSCTNCQNKDTSDNGTKPKSPVKVLQREISSNDRQDTNNHILNDNNKVVIEKGSIEETNNVQVTDLDEETKKVNDSDSEELSRKSHDIHTSDSSSTNTIGRDAVNSVEENTSAFEDKQQEVKNTDVPNGQNSSDQKYSKSKAIVMKGNKHKENTENNRTIRIRFVSEQKNDSPKRSQTVNNIIKSVFKIHPGISGEETSSKRKSNGQAKNNAKINGENEEIQPGYMILKKTDLTTQEEIVSELAQLSIQDCKDATEVGAVLS
ncbi:transcription factor mef2A [Bombus pascuorum]|uniref:transcription factor mef2A n=1 Tax=Bombus pascuorum TaxID=65598 RepID=UPI00213DD14B|nr:transcription factor mef2A [Bombus pascuorum]